MTDLAITAWEPAPGQASVGPLVDRMRAFQRPATETDYSAGRSLASTLPVEMQLFDSLSRSARLVASLSMHLPASWRQGALDQLRTLLSFDAWDDDSNLLDEASTRTFLRFVIFGNVRRMPALGISNRRRLMASWTWPDRKLFIEFAGNDHCRAVFSFPGTFDPIVRQALDGNIGDAVSVFVRHGFCLGDTTPFSGPVASGG